MLLSFVYIASHPRRVFRFPFLCHVPPARRCSQVLSCHIVCRLPLLKLFRIISLQQLRGGCVAPTFRPSDFPPYLTYPLSFHSLPHSFALTKNAALLFSIDSTLFAKNHPGWEGAALQSQRSKATEHQSLHPGRRQCYHSVET